ncbi:SH2 domain containing 1B1 [Cricetulus griseus]
MKTAGRQAVYNLDPGSLAAVLLLQPQTPLAELEGTPRLLFKKFVYTYRIFREKHGYYKIETVEGAPKQIFPNLEELVSKYEKPGQGLVIHLSNPMMRSGFCPRGRRMKLEMNVYGKSPDKGSGGTPKPASSSTL